MERTDEFTEQIEPYRAELRVHCYRMLGSLVEAEDVVQETLVAAWRGLAGFEQRSSLRTWLYRIATNRCLNARRDAGRRLPSAPVPPFTPPEPTRHGEVTWLEPFPDTLLEDGPDQAPGPEARYQQREAIELAFVAALQRLPPRQTAALVLCDVLGYPLAEAAQMLDTTPTAVKGTRQRARAAIDRDRPKESTRPALDSAQDRELSRRFADAFMAGDLDTLLALLTDNAWLAIPPAPHEYHGKPAILDFLQVSGAWRGKRRLVLVPTRANTQPAFACYLAEPDEPYANAAGLMVLTLHGDRISGMTRFLNDGVLDRFELPFRRSASAGVRPRP